MNIPEEKSIILNAIRARNNVCVTGAAGTGKSFLLKLIRDHFPHVHVTASTGIAAVNVSGVTIHSWSAIGNASSPAEEVVRFINSGPGTKIRRQLKKAKLLAIDEISMISSSVFDLLNKVFQMVKQNDAPFGGIQLVVLGDFYQLPPVSNQAQVDFCFNSESWQNANFKLFELTEIFRQSDIRFIQLLNNIRFAALNDDDLSLLNHRQALNVPIDINPTILVTHNYQADSINNEKLASLVGEEEFTYKMTEMGRENAVAFLKKNCLAQAQLTLRRGAQVMMLKNTLQKQGIINGSIGIITGFTSKDKLPIVYFNNGEKCIIIPEEWNVEVFNEEKLIKEVTGTIKQIPLALAWAITIHKSQGMTLDNVLCDLSKVFTEGQAYVAFSRVRSIEGLYLRGFKPSLLKVNSKVREFYANNPSE
jgi:ATP-dependent DNA helicase PIF1